MVEASDLDLALAIALSEGNETLSDDDFKPSKRRGNRAQKISLSAQKTTRVQKENQLKNDAGQRGDHPLHVKLSHTEVRQDDDARKASSHWSNTNKEESVGATFSRKLNDLDVAQRTTLVSVAELDKFRYRSDQRQSATLRANPIPVAADRTRLPEAESNVENLPRSPPTRDSGNCLVVDLDSNEELSGLSNETQFNILMRLCDEELLTEGSKADNCDESFADELDKENRDRGLASQQALSSSICKISDVPQLHNLVVHENIPNVHRDNARDCSAETDELDRASLEISISGEDIFNKTGDVKAGDSCKLQGDEDKERGLVNFLDNNEDDTDDITSMMTQTRTATWEGKALHSFCSEACACSFRSGLDEAEQPIRENLTEQASHRNTQTCHDVTGNANCSGGIAAPGKCVLSSHQPDVSVDNDSCPDGAATEGSLGNTILFRKSTDRCQTFEVPIPCEHSQPTDGGDSVENEQERIGCPVCGFDLSESTIEERLAHADSCLETHGRAKACPNQRHLRHSSPPLPASDPVKVWLGSLSLSKYAHLFEQQEIDWDTLQWLTDEDLFVMGIAAVGPRRKILAAVQDLKNTHGDPKSDSVGFRRAQDSALGGSTEIPLAQTSALQKETRILGRASDSSYLITKYFLRPPDRTIEGEAPTHYNIQGTNGLHVDRYGAPKRPRTAIDLNTRGVPPWMRIPGTPFRVDAFQHLSGDCSHWFLTHFHTDHYQGLTRGFRYGRIFCSLITARLVNLRIGVAWDKLMVVPLNEKFNIAGVNVTFIDANHCPGAVMMLFELPSGETILHTGDFRFCTEMAETSSLQNARIKTLILDTTYCDPQYDFPSQATVIRFVIDAIQAELFNSGTLFLIGTYTIGKERVFLEVGKALQKYVYVGAAKKKLLDCMELPIDDTKWLTCNENESFIHVVPIWSISSFKRLGCIAKHYQDRYKVIVAFSPSGWSFGKGKKKTPGKRWQQGTMIRYEVPYSEHCSFSELREFLKFTAPDDVIASVPGNFCKDGDQMIASLWNEDEASLPQIRR